MCYMIELSSLSAGELECLRRDVAREIRRRRGKRRTCVHCRVEFAGRADARYCSPKCRTAAHRALKAKETKRMSEIIGIGYEGQTLDGFVAKLRIHGVEAVVDVRLNAISRKRGFSKTALSSALNESGIDYVHMPALGNHRDNRSGYAETETVDAVAARDRFREVLSSDRASDALEALATLAREKSIALFCFEADEDHCHRQQVREALDRLLARELVNA